MEWQEHTRMKPPNNHSHRYNTLANGRRSGQRMYCDVGSNPDQISRNDQHSQGSVKISLSSIVAGVTTS